MSKQKGEVYNSHTGKIENNLLNCNKINCILIIILIKLSNLFKLLIILLILL